MNGGGAAYEKISTSRLALLSPSFCSSRPDALANLVRPRRVRVETDRRNITGSPWVSTRIYLVSLSHPTHTTQHRTMTNLTLYSVTALLLLDSAGNRIIAKYYSPPAAAQHAASSSSSSSGGAAPPPLPPNTPRQLIASNPFSTLKDQRSFEKTVLEKVSKRGTAAAGTSPSSVSGATEIQLLDSNLLLSKSSVDVHLVVVAPAEENELLVSSVLSNLWEAMGMLLAGQGIEKRSLLENLDLITLAVDEAIDDG